MAWDKLRPETQTVTEAVKPWLLPAVVGSIVEVSALTRCILLHSVCDLKVAQINVQHSLIQKLLLYELETDNYATEATKNICSAIGEGAVDQNTVTRYLKVKKA